MHCVDLICAEEHLPRVRLLQDHLQLQDVPVSVHTQPPDILSNPAILIPGTSLSDTPAGRWVAVYLQDGPRLHGVRAHFVLTNWPARSSDHDVERLAVYLKAQQQDDAADSTDQTADSSRSQRAIKKPDRQNLLAIGTLLLIVAVVALMPDTSEPNKNNAPDQPALNDSVPLATMKPGEWVQPLNEFQTDRSTVASSIRPGAIVTGQHSGGPENDGPQQGIDDQSANTPAERSVNRSVNRFADEYMKATGQRPNNFVSGFLTSPDLPLLTPLCTHRWHHEFSCLICDDQDFWQILW